MTDQDQETARLIMEAMKKTHQEGMSTGVIAQFTFTFDGTINRWHVRHNVIDNPASSYEGEGEGEGRTIHEAWDNLS